MCGNVSLNCLMIHMFVWLCVAMSVCGDVCVWICLSELPYDSYVPVAVCGDVCVAVWLCLCVGMSV